MAKQVSFTADSAFTKIGTVPRGASGRVCNVDSNSGYTIAVGIVDPDGTAPTTGALIASPATVGAFETQLPLDGACDVYVKRGTANDADGLLMIF